MSRQRVVLTGATGLIGRSVVAGLQGQHDLISVGRTPPPPGVGWIRADLDSPFDPGSMPDSADSVIYLAQSEYFRDFPGRAREIFQVNIAGVQGMLEWAQRAGVRRFVLASSGGIYGHGDNAFREDDVIAPSGPLGYYLASKHCAELLTESYASLFSVVILRFFFVYGAGQRKSMLIPRLIDSVRNGRPVTLQGPDGIRLNPTHVSDAAAAVCRALELEGSHIINVAGVEVFSLRDLAGSIGAGVGRQPVFEVRQEDAPRHLVADIGKMTSLLGAPAVGFDQGLRMMLASETAG